MTQHESHPDPLDSRGTDQVEPSGLLTGKAAALTGFTLALLSMQGQGSWTTAIQSFFGTTFGPAEYVNVLTIAGVAALAMAVASLLLARRALADDDNEATWADHLGRATMVIGGLGAALALLTIIGGTTTG